MTTQPIRAIAVVLRLTAVPATLRALGLTARRTLHALAMLVVLAPAGGLRAQDLSTAYQVKAVFLYNFARFVEWPAAALQQGPLTICVAGRNVFGDELERTVRDETVGGRPIRIRVILEPESGCHVVFVPQGAAMTAYLRAAQSEPTLTVGETPGFIAAGGIINFYDDNNRVRFEISPQAAERSHLRISSRLLQLARIVPGGEAR